MDTLQPQDKKHKIVCVGDSITEGAGASTPNMSYPSILRSRLDEDMFEIVNLGLGGRTMMRNGDCPYWNEQNFQEALASQADIIILMLGTNDSKDYQWNEGQYESDYCDMITEFQKMESQPIIWLMIPPPLYKDGTISMKQQVINEHFPRKIPEIAAHCSIAPNMIINLFEALGGPDLSNPDYLLEDACHPNDLGYFHIAKAVAETMNLPVYPFECVEESTEKSQWLHHLGHQEYQYYLQCAGNQDGKVLSHACGNIFIADHCGGGGEAYTVQIYQFPLRDTGSQEMRLYFRCGGAENDRYLSHANGQLTLQPNSLGGEEWSVDLAQTANDAPSKDEQWMVINGTGGEHDLVLGHCDGKLMLLNKNHPDVSHIQWRIRKC